MNDVDRPTSSISDADRYPGLRAPFVGTRPFTAEDAAFFFGREREAIRLSNLVIASTLTVLYGESGVGKSSLINARLPRLLGEIEPDWLVIPFFEWQLGCLTRLEQTVEATTGRAVSNGLARTLLAFAGESERPVLLVLDQFEEYFLYHPQGLNAFDAELAKLVNRRVSQVRVLLSLRSDGLFLLDRLRLRIPHIFSSMMSIEALDDEASVDCIVRPLETYNGMPGVHTVQVPARDSEIVKALISGADEERIQLRLPGRGRSELEKDERRSPRIVAPFLQMALDALWQEDVANSGRARLELSTLRQLAGLSDREDSFQAVGAIAQKYVDSILRDLSGEEKAVCALILERMVLPSGQKVAVKLVDLSTALTDDQQRLAVSLLAKLSADQTRRLVKMVAGPRDSDPHYQIVHDAMAIPLLGWVEQWKGDQRAARARREAEEKAERERALAAAKAAENSVRARRRGAIAAAFFGIIAIAVTAFVVNAYANAKSQIERLITQADYDTRSGFRLPLLLSLAAFLEVGRWPIAKDPLEQVLRKRLLQSPRDGGLFSAVGFDPERGRIAWIGDRFVVVCDLRRTKDCDPPFKLSIATADSTPLYSLPLPKPEDWDWSESRNPRLKQSIFSSIGFVSDFSDWPVLYRRGYVYHWEDGRWMRDDIADLLPDLDSHQGSIFVEILGGGLRVTVNDWPNGRMWITRIVADPQSPKRLKRESLANELEVSWPHGQPSPVASTRAVFAASLISESVDGGVLRQVRITRAGEPDSTKGAKEPLDTIKETQLGQAIGSSAARPGLGFTADNQFLAVLYRSSADKREIRVLDLSRYPKIEQAPLQVAWTVPRYPPLGNPFSFPPLAVARLSAPIEAKPGNWRFATLTHAGVRVLGGEPDGYARVAGTPVLLSGIENATRLDFSSDGEFLVLQWLNFERAKVVVRIWDLGPTWKDRIEKSPDVAALRRLACRVAAIEKGHSSLEPVEILEWQVNSQPCPADGAQGNSD